MSTCDHCDCKIDLDDHVHLLESGSEAVTEYSFCDLECTNSYMNENLLPQACSGCENAIDLETDNYLKMDNKGIISYYHDVLCYQGVEFRQKNAHLYKMGILKKEEKRPVPDRGFSLQEELDQARKSNDKLAKEVDLLKNLLIKETQEAKPSAIFHGLGPQGRDRGGEKRRADCPENKGVGERSDPTP